jgi:hypothetical protein
MSAINSRPDPFPDPRKSLNLDKLLSENPAIDEAQIREVQAFVRARRKGGRRTSYKLGSPYERG